MNNKSKDDLFVISAPSAGGKTTIIKNLLKSFKGSLHRVITCTTRERRDEEVDGVDYKFISEEKFSELNEKKAFIEHSLVYGNHYGVLKSDLYMTGKRVISLDSKGVNNFKRMQIPAVYVLITPPSLEELKARLLNRGSETEESINIRLREAKDEMDQASIFDHVVINDKLEDAIDMCKKIITGESKK